FTNADIKIPVIRDESGKEIEISHARYYAAMYSKDRDFRERAFKNYYAPFVKYANTLSTLFNGGLKTNIFNAVARKYNNALEAALDKLKTRVSVYNNLINTANKNLNLYHKWQFLIKNFLELKTLQ